MTDFAELASAPSDRLVPLTEPVAEKSTNIGCSQALNHWEAVTEIVRALARVRAESPTESLTQSRRVNTAHDRVDDFLPTVSSDGSWPLRHIARRRRLAILRSQRTSTYYAADRDMEPG
jgi:hypothetical protein